MDEEDLDKVHKEYKGILDYASKKKLYNTITQRDKEKLFLNLCSQEKTNQHTKNLVYATIFLVLVAGLQFYNTLYGTNTTFKLLKEASTIFFWLVVVFFIFQIFGWFKKTNPFNKKNIKIN